MLPTLTLSFPLSAISLYPSLNLTASPQFFSLSRYPPFLSTSLPLTLLFVIKCFN